MLLINDPDVILDKLTNYPIKLEIKSQSYVTCNTYTKQTIVAVYLVSFKVSSTTNPKTLDQPRS